MGAGGWNKGIPGAPGGGMSGKKHSEKTIKKFKEKKHTPETIKKLKERPRECYKKPQASKIETDQLCYYGCGKTANFIFLNGKYCCSESHNSCPKKRQDFSNREDHGEWAKKSLETRERLGITKTSREKAKKTMELNGTYAVLSKKSQKYWENGGHEININCKLIKYKNTKINYQGSYEFNFLSSLEEKYGINWLEQNVIRGPIFWYINSKGSKKLYISDFIIDNVIYEVKSKWTWNKHGTDFDLEFDNIAKLKECVRQGFKVILVLEGQEILYDEKTFVGRKI